LLQTQFWHALALGFTNISMNPYKLQQVYTHITYIVLVYICNLNKRSIRLPLQYPKNPGIPLLKNILHEQTCMLPLKLWYFEELFGGCTIELTGKAYTNYIVWTNDSLGVILEGSHKKNTQGKEFSNCLSLRRFGLARIVVWQSLSFQFLKQMLVLYRKSLGQNVKPEKFVYFLQ
jgi:hypothetical protein